MDGSSPPSFTAPRAETSYSPVNDPFYAAATGPQSFSDMNSGRPVSVTQDQPLLRAVAAGDPNIKRVPTFRDVAPDIGKSYKDPPADASRGPPVADSGEKPHTIGDLAAARKHTSGTVGASPYDEVKIPTISDMGGQKNGSSGNQQGGGYQYMSGPKSYNGDNFGRFTW